LVTRVYQLGIGSKRLPLSSCLLRGGGPELVDFGYSFWLIDHDDGLALVDCGFHVAAAERKGIAFERTAVEALALMGVDAGDINKIILTHLHFDHAGSLADFPRAEVCVQRSELEYFTGPFMRFPLCASGLDKKDLAAVEAAREEGRLVLLDGDAEIESGVRLHHVGGHTPGSQLVSVSNGRRRIVLTADAAHLYANLAERVPFPVLHDIPSSCVAFEVIASMDDDATDVIPGHDGDVRRRFPSVSGVPEGSILALL
jgi:glyoxylase-like metal-dependent hydrolase (beta-lactamase superfamily II)